VRGIPRKHEAEQALRRAQLLAWLTFAYNFTAVGMLFLVMGGSQALKTEMVGEVLSFIPPALFLIGDRIGRREPDRTYPFGYERAVSAGYVGSAVALLGVGAWLLFDGAMKLIMQEHPTIGGLPMFGHVVWTGWLAFGVLLWSAIPAFFLGRAKRRAAEVLHDKTLAADAEINAADWQSASAAMLGMAGVALGLWWADSAAAVVISAEIIRSGWSELRAAIGDIMDRRPQALDSKKEEPVPEAIAGFLRREPWVKDVVVRVRERGREFTAVAHVVPRSETIDVAAIDSAARRACGLDPRLAEVTVAPVKKMPPDVERART
jgi:cation diffusion facilitator family transporter